MFQLPGFQWSHGLGVNPGLPLGPALRRFFVTSSPTFGHTILVSAGSGNKEGPEGRAKPGDHLHDCHRLHDCWGGLKGQPLENLDVETAFFSFIRLEAGSLIQ